MKQIKLSNTEEFILVDDEDSQRTTLITWSSAKVRTNHFRIRGYCNGTIVSIANYIMKRFDVVYDHEDRNYLNNQKHNLRICKNSENQINRAKWITKNSTSKYKGVCYVKDHNAYKVQLNVNKKAIFLGYFSDEIKAAKEYDRAALRHYGVFAYLNFQEEIKG